MIPDYIVLYALPTLAIATVLGFFVMFLIVVLEHTTDLKIRYGDGPYIAWGFVLIVILVLFIVSLEMFWYRFVGG